VASRKKNPKQKSSAKSAAKPSPGGKVKKQAVPKPSKPKPAARKPAAKPAASKTSRSSKGKAIKSSSRAASVAAKAVGPKSSKPAVAQNQRLAPSASKPPTAAALAKTPTATQPASAAAPGNAAAISAGAGAAHSTADEDNREGNGAILSPEQLRKVKTGLKKKDLEYFFSLLMEKRSEILGDVASLESDARKEGVGVSYEHMADVGSDQYEQEFTLGLVESEAKLLREINDAILRIRDGIYGVCLKSGTPIGRARLEAKPWAKYCIEVARDLERRGQT
jgi:DnaK suppressor protein